MFDKKEKRTLICYAGSASEASIGSKPIGSELEKHRYTFNTECQCFYSRGLNVGLIDGRRATGRITPQSHNYSTAQMVRMAA